MPHRDPELAAEAAIIAADKAEDEVVMPPVKPVVHMRSWFMIDNGARLRGIVDDHPLFPPGTPVTTSRIVTVIAEDRVETLNTIYILATEEAKP